MGEVSRIINSNNIDIAGFGKKVSPERLVRLTDLIVMGSVSSTTAKPVLEEMFQTGEDADAIIAQQGLSQISDAEAIEGEVMTVIKGNKPAVADYRAGKEQALRFLVGQVMKATRGRANPQLVNAVLKKKLEEG